MAMERASAQDADMHMPIIYGYKCYLCPQQLEKDLDATNHLKAAHEIADGVTLQCMKIQKHEMFCKSTFKSFKAMRKHMKENKCNLMSADVFQNEDDQSLHGEWRSMIDDFGELKFEEENAENSMSAYIENFVSHLIISHLPHKIVNDVLDFSKELMSKTTAINKELLKNSTSMLHTNSVLDETENFITSHINKFNTRHARNKYFTNSPYYVEPQTICAGNDETFQYVPILETLKKIFTNEDFKREYFSYNRNHQCEDGVYERYCCGQNFKDTDLLQTNKNSIQIQIFFDDVQLTSPLKTKPFKVNAIYFVVRNFPPNSNSKLENMYLVSLGNSKIVDKYGCNFILEQLVRDIKILETDGIIIDGDGGEICLKGTLVQSSFDNLGGNTLFGFTKCFNSQYYCRICICTKKMCRE